MFFVCALVSFAAFVFIYAFVWGLVGRFPAESLTVSEANSNAALALCYRPEERQAAFSTFASPYGRVPSHAAVLPLGPDLHNADIGGMMGSHGLAFATHTHTMYAINPLTPDDVMRLDGFAFWGPSNQRAVGTFIKKAEASFPYCPDPQSDRGLTEAYWATKGTAVIHHWAFLYDASVFDGKPVHAQYGSIVSVVAHDIATIAKTPGPTSFVRIAWWVFCAVGILAGIGLLAVFWEYPGFGVLALSAQVLAFATLGSFTILLAPGYHWTRELVIVIPALLLVIFERRPTASRRTIALATAPAAIACYALDPSFTLFSFVCFCAAIAIREREPIARWIARDPGTFRNALVVAGVLVLGVLVADRSNLAYVFGEIAEFGTAAFANPQRNQLFAFDVFLVAALATLAWFGRVNAITAYFGFVSIAVFLYYAITPDNFHFGKYVSYSIPFFVSAGIVLYRAVIRLPVPRLPRIIDVALGVASLAMCGAAIRTHAAIGPEWQLRTYDSGLRAYFSSEPRTINGRLIDADLNATAAARLSAYPATQPYDYVVSPLDKYVLFLYDRHNGFDTVDLLSTLTSDARLASVEAALARPGKRTIIDGSTLVVNPLSGLLSNHPVFGSINDQSAANMKAQMRENELAGFLIERCANHRLDPQNRWLYVTC